MKYVKKLKMHLLNKQQMVIALTVATALQLGCLIGGTVTLIGLPLSIVGNAVFTHISLSLLYATEKNEKPLQFFAKKVKKND